MPVDRDKTIATMVPCETYSGWAAKYCHGSEAFLDLWNEVKGEKPIEDMTDKELDEATEPDEWTDDSNEPLN